MSRKQYERTKNIWQRWWVSRKWYGKTTNTDAYLKRSEDIVADFRKLGLSFSSFCELGVGSGRNIAAFHKRFPDAEYSGNDISPRIESVIQEFHPSVLDYAKIHIVDTLSLLQNPPCAMECIFTHGLLMHIPQDAIEDVMRLIFERAKVVVFCEAYHDHYRKTKEYRFERDYTGYFPEDFELLLHEPVDRKSHLYIGKKK